MSPDAKRLLQRARDADTLGRSARERMLHGLTGKLARGEHALPDIDASPLVIAEPSWLAELVSTLAGKLGLGAVAALLIASGALLLERAEPPATQSAPPPASASVPSPPAPQARDVAIAAKPTEPPEPNAAPPTERPPRPARVERARKATPRPRELEARVPIETHSEEALAAPPPPSEPALSPQPQPKPQPTLDDELVLLRRAYAELNAGRPERAFEVLDVHAERFPRGELEEAREVARMLALCAMGREPAAKVRAKHFLATRPNSPFAGRVRSMCPAKKAP